MKKKIISVLAVLLVIAGIIAGRSRKNVVSEEEAEVTIPVKIAAVEKGGIREAVSVWGDVKPWAEVTIFPEVTGRIEKIYVKEGQYVGKGDLVAEIDYEKTALTVKQTESQLKSAETNLEGLKKNYERMERLYAQKVVSEKTFDDTKTTLEAASYGVEALRSQLDMAKIRLKDSKITSPISGVVSKKYIDEGELVTEASMTKSDPLATIVDIGRVRITVAVGEKDISKIKKGQRAEITLDAYPDKRFSGEVYNIFPEVDFQTRTAQVEISVNNTDRSLKPGMFARTDIVIAKRENTVIIPADSIIEKENSKFVFVAKDGKSEIRQIETGMAEEGKIEVMSGLSEGENLIVEGQNTLDNGTKINIVE